MSKSVNQALGRQLHGLGVKCVFGLIGEETVKLAIDLQSRGIEFISSRHEGIAVGMADGYARITGKLGVVLISRGPGLTNGLSQTVTASKGKAPIVVIMGDTDVGIDDPAQAESSRSHMKHIEQEAAFDACGVTAVTLRSPGSAAADFLAVCERATLGETSAVNIPVDVLEAPAGGDHATISFPPTWERNKAPDPDEIAVVADLLGEGWAARRLVILAGRGAIGAENDLTAIGEACGALLTNSLRAQSIFGDNPWALGTSGTVADQSAIEMLREADLVLAFGASLNIFTTAQNEMFPNASVVRFDADPEAFATGTPAELTVTGDARLSAAALRAELERRGHRKEGYRTPAVKARLEEVRATPEPFPDRGTVGKLDPRAVIRKIRSMFPEDFTVVIDNGHNTGWPFSHARVKRPIDFVWPGHSAQVGAAGGVALGVAAGNRDERLTACFMGDLAFMMTLSDIDTPIRYGLKVLIVVINDHAFGAEIRYLDTQGLPSDIVCYTTPDFAAIAAAAGGRGLTVDRLEDLDQLPGLLDGLGGPLVVDCHVDPAIADDWVPLFYGEKKPIESYVASAS